MNRHSAAGAFDGEGVPGGKQLATTCSARDLGPEARRPGKVTASAVSSSNHVHANVVLRTAHPCNLRVSRWRAAARGVGSSSLCLDDSDPMRDQQGIESELP